MADFLLELLSEEIPARMQARARADLQRMMAEALQGAGLGHGAITAYSTPRRLALIVRDVAAGTKTASEELKGPRTSAPPQALEGFLRKAGLTPDQLEDRGGTWFAKIDRPGKAASAIIGEAVSAIVADFPWPKSMRWGDGELRWVRPLHSIIALLGADIVPIAVAGITSGATTLGHRFHHPGTITIGGATDYAEKLRACHVLVDQEEREALIRDGAALAATAAGLTLIEDEGLVVENAGMTEWPVSLFGEFDPDFLDVPREVIVLTMRTNQKYFACAGADGGLAPAFVCIANIDANDGGASIVEGNRRVLAARLADARFFWEQDVKIPLEEQARKLDGIVFHEKLGTVADKVERVAKLARWLVEEGIVKPSPLVGEDRGGGRDASASQVTLSAADAAGPHPSPSPQGGGVENLADQAERAARLAKADLVTGMVGEFPELQGVIGGYLAEAQGEPKAVADAIRDHYKPVGQGDDVPTAPVTVAVSLADKLDSLLLFPSAGMMPTGSSDSFAIRRAAIAVIRLLIANNVRVPLRATLRYWYDLLGDMRVTDTEGVEYVGALRRYHDIVKDDFTYSVQSYQPKGLPSVEWEELSLAFVNPSEVEYNKTVGLDTSDEAPFYYYDFNAPADVIKSVWSFFADRLKVQQREAGVRHDLIDAVFGVGGEDDLVRLLARVKALQAFVETEDGADLLAGYKRAGNILKKEKWDEGAAGKDDVAVEEAALTKALDKAEPKATKAIEKEDFTAAMAALASLRGPIDAFFDAVKVNADDKATRARRLSLLARFRDAVNRVADFSKIEG